MGVGQGCEPLARARARGRDERVQVEGGDVAPHGEDEESKPTDSVLRNGDVRGVKERGKEISK